MKIALTLALAATLPATAQAENRTGKGPTVICQAQEFLRGEVSMETAFTRYDLSKNTERDDFLPQLVLQGHRFRLSAFGSANSELELWLRIDDFLYPNQSVYSRGLESGALTRVVDHKTYARITCDKESELKERYLANFCNPDGSVKDPDNQRFLDKVTRDCRRLREIEVIKEPPPPPPPPAPCEPTPEQPCPGE